ncbi:hypothetical protein CCFV1_ORF061 [Cotesia congregata filamentous virus 1]|uniref:Uncharacterized protein n=1 Tax=Cotesia congregata filamentous virus 1 TaxID=3064291 RepID=A0ABC8QJN5_9VIRU|nr:hypothetical protein CCFV1_ORF061 [Cotesia congregata filamentous virus 1]
MSLKFIALTRLSSVLKEAEIPILLYDKEGDCLEIDQIDRAQNIVIKIAHGQKLTYSRNNFCTILSFFAISTDHGKRKLFNEFIKYNTTTSGTFSISRSN